MRCPVGTVISADVWVQTIYGPQDVTLGVVDGRAREAFTTGQCHALALALHQATGWDLLAAGVAGRAECCPAHWAVRVPDGRVLDIEGVHGYREFTGEWGSVRPVTVDRWREAHHCCYLPANLQAAKFFVRPVLGYVPECEDARPSIVDYP
jgi:hypothetical protein